jgi:serine/threonine protein kinase
VHRDIKPENILCDPQSFIITLIDFVFAQRHQKYNEERHVRYKDKRKDRQEEEEVEVGNSEADESKLHRASGSEDARVNLI